MPVWPSMLKSLPPDLAQQCNHLGPSSREQPAIFSRCRGLSPACSIKPEVQDLSYLLASKTDEAQVMLLPDVYEIPVNSEVDEQR